ncbi:restriction endonuclease subunit S [Candidatus Latescibacterota bacterium]
MSWDRVRLGDICKISKTKHDGKRLPYVGMENIKSGTGQLAVKPIPTSVKSATFRFNENIVLYGRLRPYLNKVLLPDFEGHCSTEIFPIECGNHLDKRFLFYWLTSENTVRRINRTSTGTRMPRANVNALLNFEFPFPPLPEQKSIVAILDEAFEGIDQAVVNTEKNLANTRELFESYLNGVFEKNGEGWEEKRLETCINSISTPIKIPRKKFQDSGPFPIISQEKEQINGYWSDKKALIHIESPLVIFGDHTQILKYIDFDFVVGADGVKLLHPKSYLDAKYFYYFLKANPIVSLGYARHYRLLKEIGIIFPESLEHQKLIAAELGSLESEIQHLESIYKKKLEFLYEIKQSILQKAFSGELNIAVNERS